MRYYTLLAVLFSAVLFIGGCKKKDDPSRKELIARTWKLTAQTSDPSLPLGGSQLTDVYSQLRTCFKDNTYIFESSGSYRSEEGASKCNDSDPVIVESGTWTLSSDEKTLSVTTANGNSRTEYTIVSISSSEMKATYIFNLQGSTLNYKQSVTFTAQ
ncbi:DUF5004 domain-containing protein [Nostoc sp. NIES-2111]